MIWNVLFSISFCLWLYLGWIEGFKYIANTYNLNKTSPKKMHRHLLHQREDCPKMRIALYTHIYTYTGLWTFTDLWSLFSAFSDPVSEAFLILLKVIFLMRSHTTIFEKIDFLWGSQVTTVNSCKSYFYPQWLLLRKARGKRSIFVK